LPNVSEYVVAFVKDCELCVRNTPQTVHPPLTPLISKQPLDIIMADFFGPIDADPITGDRYIQFQ